MKNWTCCCSLRIHNINVWCRFMLLPRVKRFLFTVYCVKCCWTTAIWHCIGVNISFLFCFFVVVFIYIIKCIMLPLWCWIVPQHFIRYLEFWKLKKAFKLKNKRFYVPCEINHFGPSDNQFLSYRMLFHFKLRGVYVLSIFFWWRAEQATPIC